MYFWAIICKPVDQIQQHFAQVTYIYDNNRYANLRQIRKIFVELPCISSTSKYCNQLHTQIYRAHISGSQNEVDY